MRYLNQTSNRYEARIRHLEEIVCHLLTDKEHAFIALKSPAPLAGSFRYSKEKGLVPLLSKTAAEALSTGWKNIIQGKTTPPTLSGHRPHLLFPAQTHSLNTPSDNILQPSHAPTISSCRSGSLPASGLHRSMVKAPSRTLRSCTDFHPRPPAPSSDHLTFARSQSVSVSPRSTDLQPPPADTGFVPSEEQPFSLDNRSPCLPNSPSTHAFNITTPHPTQLGSLGIDSLADLKVGCTWPLTDPIAPKTCASSSNTPAPSSVHITAVQPHGLRPSSPHPSEHIPSLPNDRSSQQPGNLSDDNLTATQPKTEHASPSSHTSTPPLGPLQDNLAQALISNIGDTLSTPSAPSLVYAPRPLPALSGCSSQIYATAQPFLENLDVDAMGSIDVVDESDGSVDPQLTLEYSRVMLEYNNDMDDFLKLSASHEIENKKKKKKKKKKKTPDHPTSISDNPVLFYV
ncbi:hypothetical protein MJO28_009797 [Puccinia striiformis f. sp. tritici]|uniref:Uncharacterized protein n=1 Tax=Puccinia striiformis f. sp. tritici TaxID=168172 RepID=A0ACC0EBE3_9BASI|nr:hypothetical protein MJO28_009797 [Puccinia striiformis f. sp. tritici]